MTGFISKVVAEINGNRGNLESGEAAARYAREGWLRERYVVGKVPE